MVGGRLAGHLIIMIMLVIIFTLVIMTNILIILVNITSITVNVGQMGSQDINTIIMKTIKVSSSVSRR